MKNIQISKRLKYVADFITPGLVLADIGTDHGFIPIYMVLDGKTPKAYAMDINEGPLERAKEHILEKKLEDKIETRLSDGLNKLRGGEAQSVLIAGMGGALIIKILSEGGHALKGVEELILSPHTEADLVREFLKNTEFIIEKEGMVIDAGKYYVVIKARRRKIGEEGFLYEKEDKSPQGLEEELYRRLCIKYGRILLEEKNLILKEFLNKELGTYNKIYEGLKSNVTEAGLKRREEIYEILEHLKAAINIL